MQSTAYTTASSESEYKNMDLMKIFYETFECTENIETTRHSQVEHGNNTKLDCFPIVRYAL